MASFSYKISCLALITACSMAKAGKLDITLSMDDSLTSDQKKAIQSAADFWGSTLSVPSLVRAPFHFTVGAVEVDGPGGTLAFTGCDGIFEKTQIPSGATIWFDRQDARNMMRSGTFKDAVLHEMAHGLGFGGAWDLSRDWPWPTEVLAQQQGGHPVFIGKNACAAYSKLSGRPTSAITLEHDGDAGTYGGHWSKRLFGAELMTGYYSGGTISPITLAAFSDMTYEVDMRKASSSYRIQGRALASPLLQPLFEKEQSFRQARSVTRLTEEGERLEIPLDEYKEDEGR